MDVWYTAGAGHGADVLRPASSKTQPALPDMLPSCDVDVSPLTGVRAWALGKTSLPVVGQKPPSIEVKSVSLVQRALDTTFWFC